jgi:hypothetical protein
MRSSGAVSQVPPPTGPVRGLGSADENVLLGFSHNDRYRELSPASVPDGEPDRILNEDGWKPVSFVDIAWLVHVAMVAQPA